MFRCSSALARTNLKKFRRGILTDKIDLAYYTPFDVVGTHQPPPQTAIWMNKTYKFGYLLYGLQYVFNDPRLGEDGVEKRIIKHFQGKGFFPTQIVSRLKEDGCFVYFEDLKTAEKALEHIRIMPMHKSQTSYLVLGTPFFEDLVLRRPTVKLGCDLTVEKSSEDLFYVFRPYGRISRIVVDEKSKKAEVLYWKKASAIAAKNCLHHSHFVNDQTLYLRYLPHYRFQRFQEYFISPKLLPVWAILLTVILYLLVEPIRLFSVTQSILFGKESERAKKKTALEIPQRVIDVEAIKAMLEEVPDSVILISGAKGAGKGTVIKEIAATRRLSVRIDCKRENFSAASSTNSFIDDLEKTVGYYPTFSAVTSLIGYFEMMLPMKKPALSSTQQTQLANVLNTMETALRMIGVGRAKTEYVHVDYPVIIFNGFQDLMQRMEQQSKDEKDKAKNLIDLLLKWSMANVQRKRAHIVFVCNDNSFTEEAFREYPEFRGRIRQYHIDDLDHDSVMDYLGKRVTVRSEDSNMLAKEKVPAAPRPPPQPVLASDSKVQLFMNIVLFRGWRTPQEPKLKEEPTVEVIETHHTDSDEKTKVLCAAAKVIGGRVNDIQSLIHRIKRGFTIQQSIESMVTEVKDEIMYGGFGEKLFYEPTGKRWTQSQLWRTLKVVVEKESVPYHTLLHSVFEGDQAALDALINSDILNIRDKNIMSFSPLYLHTFKEIVQDPAMIKGMEKLCCQVVQDKAKKKILDIQEELIKIHKADMDGSSITARKAFLDQKLADLNDILTTQEEKEREIARIKI